MKETIDTIIQWHRDTFADETLEGQFSKFNEEKTEMMMAIGTHRLEELADMYIVSCGIARFNYAMGLDRMLQTLNSLRNYTIQELLYAVESKMEKNRKRVWVKSGEGHYHHKNGIED